MKVLFDILLEHITGPIKVELEVEKEYSFLRKMVHFIKELGRTTTCGATVG